MAASARKRGFSAATVARGKTRYLFLCGNASCLQFVEAFLRFFFFFDFKKINEQKITISEKSANTTCASRW